MTDNATLIFKGEKVNEFRIFMTRKLEPLKKPAGTPFPWYKYMIFITGDRINR